jgi:hypothetical protein
MEGVCAAANRSYKARTRRSGSTQPDLLFTFPPFPSRRTRAGHGLLFGRLGTVHVLAAGR